MNLSADEWDRLRGLLVKAHWQSLSAEGWVDLRYLLAREYRDEDLLAMPRDAVFRMGVHVVGLWELMRLSEKVAA